ncbi:MAG: TIGR00282 family metallophosphoesterase [Parvularculaceae bacterium]|nr:MAG: TIGR00282 family metallophosphoesterase [Parvularculaceae bacterium]
MRIALLGDIVGRTGRTAVCEQLPRLRRRLKLDFVVVNAENAAGGFGVTPSICDALFDAGADVLTTGNHAFDQRDKLDLFDAERRLLRPLNFPEGNPGRGSTLVQTANGENVLVVNLQGQRGMPPTDDPCAAIDRELDGVVLGREADAVLVDFHAEATSEKYALGHYLAGRVTAVVGTHTHVPTADHHVMRGGTAYMTDLGMCGDYDSVIGMEKTEPVQRFQTKMNMGRLNPATGDATVCGLFVETDATGRAIKAAPIRLGGALDDILPDVNTP